MCYHYSWMFELRGYIDENGNKPFSEWFEGLGATAAAKVTIALTSMEQGNFSNVRGVGSGVFEYKVQFGPGYVSTSTRTARAWWS